ALAIGWLDALVPSDDLLAHAGGIATRIAAMPPASIAAVKEVVNTTLDGSLHDGLTAESAALARLMDAELHREPMSRFLAAGGQTRAGETERMTEIVDGLLDR